MSIKVKALKNKIIKISIILVILIPILWVVNEFTGNPISAQIAKHKISDYLSKVYGYDQSINTPRYNFVSPGYWVETPIGKYGYNNNRITDYKVVDYFNTQINKDYDKIKSSFTDNLILPKSIYLGTSVVANGDYSKEYSKLKINQRIYILDIWNKDISIKKEESEKMCSNLGWKVIDSLSNAGKYNITGSQIGYLDVNGYYQTTQFLKKPITLDILRGDTERSEIEALDAQEFIKSIKK